MQSTYVTSINRVTVIGAGTMGHGIAHVAALCGCEVRLYDAKPEALAKGLTSIEANLAKGVALGKLDAAAATATLTRITGAQVLAEAVAEADLVIEAVPEVPELKRELFGQLASLARPAAILATNTSSISVGMLAHATTHPARVVGLHFFNPVHVMKLLEVVRHDAVDAEVLALCVAFAQRLGKQPIVVADKPGFASSRLGLALGLEAMRMVEEGVASAHDIDTAMKLGYGHPMGPLELTDVVGLDVRLGIAEYLSRHLGPAFTPPPVLREHVRAGRLGKKSGQGFYAWQDGKPVR